MDPGRWGYLLLTFFLSNACVTGPPQQSPACHERSPCQAGSEGSSARLSWTGNTVGGCLLPFGQNRLVLNGRCTGAGSYTGIRTHRHQTHHLTKPGFWSLQKLGEKKGKRGGTRGKCGGGGLAGIAHGMWVMEGCGGMRLMKMGGKWEKRDEIPIFHSPILPIFRKSKTLSPIPFVTISSPHSPTEKMFLPLTDAHRGGG